MQHERKICNNSERDFMYKHNGLITQWLFPTYIQIRWIQVLVQATQGLELLRHPYKVYREVEYRTQMFHTFVSNVAIDIPCTAVCCVPKISSHHHICETRLL